MIKPNPQSRRLLHDHHPLPKPKKNPLWESASGRPKKPGPSGLCQENPSTLRNRNLPLATNWTNNASHYGRLGSRLTTGNRTIALSNSRPWRVNQRDRQYGDDRRKKAKKRGEGRPCTYFEGVNAGKRGTPAPRSTFPGDASHTWVLNRRNYYGRVGQTGPSDEGASPEGSEDFRSRGSRDSTAGAPKPGASTIHQRGLRILGEQSSATRGKEPSMKGRKTKLLLKRREDRGSTNSCSSATLASFVWRKAGKTARWNCLS